MKEIKDYLHLYLGCGVKILIEKSCYYFVHTLSVHKNEVVELNTLMLHYLSLHSHKLTFKPILRPLSDMTKEEFFDICKCLETKSPNDIQKKIITKDDKSWVRWYIVRGGEEEIIANISDDKNAIDVFSGNNYYRCYVKLIPYLISKHFDLFSLIPEGLAIDKTTL